MIERAGLLNSGSPFPSLVTRYTGRIEAPEGEGAGDWMAQPAQLAQISQTAVMVGNTAAQTAQLAKLQPANDNLSAYIRAVSTEVTQSIQQGTIVPATQGNVIQIPLRNVGLVKGFIVQINATLTNSGSAAASLTTWNAANILSNITYYDLDNYQRINCAGWFMSMINTAKEGFPFGAAILSTAMDTPVKYGNNFNVISASATIADDSGTGTVNMRYWVPLAYSSQDLRGAVWLGVVNSTSYLQLTLNPTPGAGANDPTLAVYSGANSTITMTSVTYQIYQVYLDQVPRDQNNAPVLPPIDVATQYRLNTTSLTAVSVGQDFPIPFTNFQQFLSLGIIYDQAGTLNGGTDINNFALRAANTYVPFLYDPFTQALKSRIAISTDYPDGSYNFSFRMQPVLTNQTGNMQLTLNPSSAASGTVVYCGFESFALIDQILGAASLPAS